MLLFAWLLLDWPWPAAVGPVDSGPPGATPPPPLTCPLAAITAGDDEGAWPKERKPFVAWFIPKRDEWKFY